MNTRKSSDPRIDPWGTPLTTGIWLETSSSRTTRCCPLLRKAEIQLLKHLDQHNILVDCQYGFRSKRSCKTQLLTLSHELLNNLHTGKKNI
jgi:hypothetical protein